MQGRRIRPEQGAALGEHLHLRGGGGRHGHQGLVGLILGAVHSGLVGVHIAHGDGPLGIGGDGGVINALSHFLSLQAGTGEPPVNELVGSLLGFLGGRVGHHEAVQIAQGPFALILTGDGGQLGDAVVHAGSIQGALQPAAVGHQADLAGSHHGVNVAFLGVVAVVVEVLHPDQGVGQSLVVQQVGGEAVLGIALDHVAGAEALHHGLVLAVVAVEQAGAVDGLLRGGQGGDLFGGLGPAGEGGGNRINAGGSEQVLVVVHHVGGHLEGDAVQIVILLGHAQISLGEILGLQGGVFPDVVQGKQVAAILVQVVAVEQDQVGSFLGGKAGLQHVAEGRGTGHVDEHFVLALVELGHQGLQGVTVAAGPAVPEHHGGLLAFAAGNSHGQQHGQRENQGKQFLHVGFLLFYFISVLAR